MSDSGALKRAGKPNLLVGKRGGRKVTLALGRWVKTYSPNLGVCMRPIKPYYGRYVPGGCPMGVLAEILREASGTSDLSQLLLLVAPGSRSFPRKIHCFGKKTQTHLGVIGITESEVEVLMKYENMLKYELNFSNQYFSAKTMTCDKETIAKLFERKSGGDGNQEKPLFQSTLNYCSNPKEFCSVGVQTQLSRPHIRALNNPKIPVRLRNIENIRRMQTIQALSNVTQIS